MKVVAIVPAYNEEKTIGQVITDLKNYVDEIIVVNDGSTDRTGQIAEKTGAIVYNHLLNRGLGAALKTGFQAALMSEAEIIVTFDADGQHQAEDIPRLIKPILNGEAEVVIGSRFIRNSLKSVIGRKTLRLAQMLRFFYNQIANFVTFLFFGFGVTDSQSGLRAFSRLALERIQINCDRMEVSSEIISQIKKQNLRFVEIPISAIYSEYSLSKGQNFLMGVKTLLRLLIHKFS